MRPHLPRTALALGLTLAAIAAASAGGGPGHAGDVRVTIAAITASSQHQTVDPKLREIAREVQRRQSDLSGYKLGQTDSRALNVGQKESFWLVDDAKADITVLAKDEGGERVRLAVKVPLMGEISYQTCYDKFFPIVTRYLTKDDRERLIVAIMVKSAAKEKK